MDRRPGPEVRLQTRRGERGGRGAHTVRYRGANFIRRVPLDSEGAAVHKDKEEGHRVAGSSSSPSSIGTANCLLLIRLAGQFLLLKSHGVL